MNPKLIMAGAALAALVLALFLAYNQGRKIERANWIERDNKATIEATMKLQAANERAIAAERKNAQDLADVSQTYQKELSHARNETARAVAAVRTGAIRLRDPRQGTGDRDTVPEVGTTATGCDAAKGSELPGADAEFLVRLAGEADEVAKQLSACQAIIRKDRE